VANVDIGIDTIEIATGLIRPIVMGTVNVFSRRSRCTAWHVGERHFGCIRGRTDRLRGRRVSGASRSRGCFSQTRTCRLSR